jgi:5'-methylthioadenosine phosphorylase
MSKIAIIGGTGVYDPSILDNIKEVEQSTPYGKIKAIEGTYHDKAVLFMNRHGEGHSIPPHMINYRANIWGLKELDADCILATAAVGSLNRDMAPGNFVFPDQYIEFTKDRHCTFFDGGEMGVVHTDMTEPYCPHIRDAFIKASKKISHTAHDGGTYVCTEGPRFETPAEIKMYHMLGGDLVGMTAYPEVALAKELGLCYGAVAMVTNFAAGISDDFLSHQEVLNMMAQLSRKIKELLLTVVDILPEDENCHCRNTAESM